MKTKLTTQPPSIPPALVLEPGEQTGLINFCTHRIPGQPLEFQPVTLAEACARTEEVCAHIKEVCAHIEEDCDRIEALLAEVTADRDGEYRLILHEDLPDELMDLVDSGQQMREATQ